MYNAETESLFWGFGGQKGDSEDEDGMSDSDDEDEDEPPVMHHRQIAHPGGVNRVRAMPQQPSVVATWSEKGTVQVRSL
jgi:ribosome assembly protein RRB1